MNDSDLRARFERLREEERSAAPAFMAVGHGRPRRAVTAWRWRLAAAVAAGLLLALLGGLWHHRLSIFGSEAEPALADWRSPTAFLLATPNRELFSELPQVGAIPLLPRSTP